MIFRGNRIRKPALARLAGDSPICGRPGCGHPRLRHYTKLSGETGCAANQVWPHAHPETGEHVPASHCRCEGFVTQSTKEGP